MDTTNTDQIGVVSREVVLDLTEAVDITINRQLEVGMNQRQLLHEPSNESSFEGVCHRALVSDRTGHIQEYRSIIQC